MAPNSSAALTIVERLPGSATTDFGALARLAGDDRRAITDTELDRLESLLSACWATFDAALQEIPRPARSVRPKVGRSPAQMRLHLLDTDAMHLSAFGPTYREPAGDAVEQLEPAIRSQLLGAIRALPPGRTFEPKRRYGFDWTPRFAVRRAAWHALDHAWQLEDDLSNQIRPPG